MNQGTKEHITVVRGYDVSHHAAIVQMMMEQDKRQNSLGFQKQVARTEAQIERSMTPHVHNTMPPLLALDEDGNVRGYVQPVVWELTNSALLQMFPAQQNGMVLNLTLPSPQDDDAHLVAQALLAALSEGWERSMIGGDLLCWSYHDTWVEPLLRSHRFTRRGICGSFPLVLSSVEQVDSSTLLRTAKPSDEQGLVELLHEEQLLDPYVLSNALHTKLCRKWSDPDVEEGAPFLLIAERDGQIVAFAEAALVFIGSENEPELLSPGCYGTINVVYVRASLRRQGLAHQLMRVIVRFFTFRRIKPIGWLLPNTLENPDSELFWPHLDFQPFLTLYQREGRKI